MVQKVVQKVVVQKVVVVKSVLRALACYDCVSAKLLGTLLDHFASSVPAFVLAELLWLSSGQE